MGATEDDAPITDARRTRQGSGGALQPPETGERCRAVD